MRVLAFTRKNNFLLRLVYLYFGSTIPPVLAIAFQVLTVFGIFGFQEVATNSK
jgi:hypothetical protein